MPIVICLDIVMLEKKITLNQLSEKVGITNVNLSRIKNNKVNMIRFSALNSICKALECQPRDIIKFVDEADLIRGK